MRLVYLVVAMGAAALGWFLLTQDSPIETKGPPTARSNAQVKLQAPTPKKPSRPFARSDAQLMQVRLPTEISEHIQRIHADETLCTDAVVVSEAWRVLGASKLEQNEATEWARHLDECRTQVVTKMAKEHKELRHRQRGQLADRLQAELSSFEVKTEVRGKTLEVTTQAPAFSGVAEVVGQMLMNCTQVGFEAVVVQTSDGRRRWELTPKATETIIEGRLRQLRLDLPLRL